MTMHHIRGDSSVAFLSEGYRFGQRRFDRFDSDAFTTRLMLRPVTFIRGSDASRFFYEGNRFTRDRALPTSVLHSLQDEGSVQTLTGADHRRRKALFLDMMTPASMAELAGIFNHHWGIASATWVRPGGIILHTEVARILTMTACDWAGVGLRAHEIEPRTVEFTEMVARAGTFGVPNWRARALRLRTEKWARDAIRGARAADSSSGTPLAAIAHHRDANGQRLDVPVAAVELLNVIRPTVAVARFIVFAAWALHHYPTWRSRIADAEDGALEAFVHEVRRFSPFFPAVGGRAAQRLEWHGRAFEPGDWVMLDLFATDRHPRLWDRPEAFDPERFSVPHSRNALVPQGGGLPSDGHRCAGEMPTVDLVAQATKLLSTMNWELPPQDLRISLRHMPTLPESGVIMECFENR